MENKKYNRKLQYNELIFEDGKEGSQKIVLTEQEAINIQKEKLKSIDITKVTKEIDQYFSDAGYEKLEYRSIDFVIERFKNMNYY